jgi:hypothetical protein
VPKCGWLVVFMLPAMIVSHCRDIAPDDEVTLSPRSNCRRACTTLSYAMRATSAPGSKCQDHTTRKYLPLFPKNGHRQLRPRSRARALLPA